MDWNVQQISASWNDSSLLLNSAIRGPVLIVTGVIGCISWWGEQWHVHVLKLVLDAAQIVHVDAACDM